MNYSIDIIRSFGQAVSVKAGMSPTDAAVFIDNLIESDLRGVRSHGTTKLRAYLSRIEHGVSDPAAQPTITQTAPSSFRIDGNNGMGSTIAWKAMETCITAAKESGVAFAAVHNASHHGFGGYYVIEAAKQGMIGFAVCNTAALVAPYGGAKPMLGTNPMSIALPASKYPALVLDMATSVVAKGKIALALKEGKAIPTDWALDSKGKPTTDPAAADKGCLLPFGGPKGYALSLIIEVLCSCLAGGGTSLQIPRVFDEMDKEPNIGYFFGAFDISKFIPLDLFKANVDALFDQMKDCPAAEGFSSVMIPGEIEYTMAEKNRSEGISLSTPVLKEFQELAARYEIAYPF